MGVQKQTNITATPHFVLSYGWETKFIIPTGSALKRAYGYSNLRTAPSKRLDDCRLCHLGTTAVGRAEG